MLLRKDLITSRNLGVFVASRASKRILSPWSKPILSVLSPFGINVSLDDAVDGGDNGDCIEDAIAVSDDDNEDKVVILLDEETEEEGSSVIVPSVAELSHPSAPSSAFACFKRSLDLDTNLGSSSIPRVLTVIGRLLDNDSARRSRSRRATR